MCNIRYLSTAIGLVAVLSIGPARADSAGANDELLRELRALKQTVQQQQQRIEQLEQRLARGEAASGAPVSVFEIDKRIDERLSRREPAYQLMEGLSLSVGATSVIQAVHNANGSAQLSKKEDVTDASVSTDIVFNKKFDDYGEGLVYVTAGQGAGVEDKLQLYSNVNADADNDQNVRLAEVWYEQYFKPVSAALTVGKLDATNYIDTNEYANDETSQFLGRMFGNSPVIEFPSNGAGIHFGISPADMLDINLVALDGDADWEDAGDGMFVAGQVNLKPKLFDRGGNYRILAWRNNTAHTKWADSAKDKEDTFGWGLSFDQELTDVLGIFFRYGWQDPDVFTNGSSFSLKRSWSAGPQFSGSLWGRADDCLGLGFGQITPSEKYKSASAVLAKTESHLECYYSYKVNEHLTISPDLHLIWKPYGKDASNGDGTIVVTGLRGQMDF